MLHFYDTPPPQRLSTDINLHIWIIMYVVSAETMLACIWKSFPSSGPCLKALHDCNLSKEIAKHAFYIAGFRSAAVHGQQRQGRHKKQRRNQQTFPKILHFVSFPLCDGFPAAKLIFRVSASPPESCRNILRYSEPLLYRFGCSRFQGAYILKRDFDCIGSPFPKSFP